METKTTITSCLLATVTATMGAMMLSGGGGEQLRPEPVESLQVRPLESLEPQTRSVIVEAEAPRRNLPAAPGGAAPRRAEERLARLPRVDIFISRDAHALLPHKMIKRLERGDYGVKATFEMTSNRAAIEHVMAERADLAFTVKPPSRTESAAGVAEMKIGTYVPALVVHPDNPVRNLSSSEVRRALRGRIDSWSSLGGPDHRVQLVLPPQGRHSDHLANMLIKGDNFGEALRDPSEGRRLAMVRAKQGGITIVSLRRAVREGVSTLSIDGVTAGDLERRVGQYPYGCEVYVVHRGHRNEGASTVLNLLHSPEGRRDLGQTLFAD